MTGAEYRKLVRRTVSYEWDIETVDEQGDVENHHHADRLADLPPLQANQRLVLVRDYGCEADGLEDRQWAYVEEGVLPEFFQTTGGADDAAVPERFRAEFNKYIGR